jgi:hypothetical protein
MTSRMSLPENHPLARRNAVNLDELRSDDWKQQGFCLSVFFLSG